MIGQSPFVVIVTTPSGGVGKSTLASNLAVYLRGLAENLPVACVSGDADVTERMFAFAGSQIGCLTGLQQGQTFTELLCFGEYGVEFCYAGSLAESAPPSWLRRKLLGAAYPGILIVDLEKGHPLLPAALWAADLVLAPVKDPAILGEVVNLRKEFLCGGGYADQFWLLASEVGAEGRFRRSGRLGDFLRFAAEERGFRVLEETFVSDQQVFHQAVTMAKPILTRVPKSALHQQLLQMAELVLGQSREQFGYDWRIERMLRDGDLPARARRVDLVCPLCCRGVLGADAHYCEAFPSRARLTLHRHCLSRLLEKAGAAAFIASGAFLLIQPGASCGGQVGQLRVQTLSPEMELLNSELLLPFGNQLWERLLKRATGRHFAELYSEQLLVSAPYPAKEILDADWYRHFVSQRRCLRVACENEKI